MLEVRRIDSLANRRAIEPATDVVMRSPGGAPLSAEARRMRYMSDDDVANLANVSVAELTRRHLDRCIPSIDHRSARGAASDAAGSTPGGDLAAAGAAQDQGLDDTLACHGDFSAAPRDLNVASSDADAALAVQLRILCVQCGSTVYAKLKSVCPSCHKPVCCEGCLFLHEGQ